MNFLYSVTIVCSMTPRLDAGKFYVRSGSQTFKTVQDHCTVVLPKASDLKN